MADSAYRMHHGDALQVLPTLPDQSVDGVLTDPPYSSGSQNARTRTGSTARAKYVSSDAQHRLPDFPGDQRDQHSYLRWLSMILADCYRICRPAATAMVFTDWRQLPTTVDAVQIAGWTWQGIVVWHKRLARPTRNGFRRDAEFIVWGSKGPGLYRHPEPLFLPGLVTGSQPSGRKRRHITQKPAEVLRQLVQIIPAGGTVLDPFAGSGSTGAAANAEGRGFIGIEVSGHYHAVATEHAAGHATSDTDPDPGADTDNVIALHTPPTSPSRTADGDATAA